MRTFYVASRLDNVAQVRELAAYLREAGWHQTYDWTIHGSVKDDELAMRRVSEAEVRAVAAADVVVFLLPGGRGTHVELGVALGGWTPTKRVVLNSPEPLDASAFYYHPAVRRRIGYTMRELADELLEGWCPCRGRGCVQCVMF